MKTLKKICAWGGAFLLTLSIIAGVCLVTLPSKTNANAADNNQITSLTENNTIPWKVVELDGTNEQNLAKVKAVPNNEPYVKYILRRNWDATEKVTFRGGKYVVLDVNGYTLHMATAAMTHYTGVFNEITDSSPSGSGQLQGYASNCGMVYCGTNLIISGATITPLMDVGGKLIITGGHLFPQGMYDVLINGVPKDFFLPSYISAYTNAQGKVGYRVNANTTGASFAVYGATDNTVSGVYNYEFTQLIENLGPGNCILEKVGSANYPNYLWYRSSPSAQYQVIATL